MNSSGDGFEPRSQDDASDAFDWAVQSGFLPPRVSV
jgi:hypothetical protein